MANNLVHARGTGRISFIMQDVECPYAAPLERFAWLQGRQEAKSERFALWRQQLHTYEYNNYRQGV